MGPQNRSDGMHPDTMIKEFRALLDIAQDAMHRVTIFNGTEELINHMSRNHMCISDEQLHTMVLGIYQGNKVQVEGSVGERISQTR
jgi:hypothetical protein